MTKDNRPPAFGFDPSRIARDPWTCGGRPRLPGTRFTVAQLLAEIADGGSIADVASNFDIEYDLIVGAINELSIHPLLDEGSVRDRSSEAAETSGSADRQEPGHEVATPKSSPDQTPEGCILCCNGAELPEGEYCRACGRGYRADGLRRALDKVEGRAAPPTTKVAFASPDQTPVDPPMSVEEAKPCHWGGGNDIIWCSTCGAEYAYAKGEERPPCPRTLQAGGEVRDA